MLEFKSYAQAYRVLRDHLARLDVEVRPDDEDLFQLEAIAEALDAPVGLAFSLENEAPARHALREALELARQSRDGELRDASLFLLRGAWARLSQSAGRSTPSLWKDWSTVLARASIDAYQEEMGAFLNWVLTFSPSEQNRIVGELWGNLGLVRIQFKSFGRGVTPLPLFMKGYVEARPVEEKKFARVTDYAVHRTTRGDFLAPLKLVSAEFRQIHRSSIYQLPHGRDLILKKVEGENLADEGLWWETIRRMRLFPQGDLPEPVLDAQGRVQVLDLEDGSRVVPLIVGHDYFYYLNEVDFPRGLFISGLTKSVRTAVALADQGIYHMVPIEIYHAKNTDGMHRFYSWAPNIALRPDMAGMGEVDDIKGALSFPNYSIAGLRDGEDFKSEEEVIRGRLMQVDRERAEPVPLTRSVNRMLLTGTHLFAAGLLIGNRMVEEGRSQGKDLKSLWKDEVTLKIFAGLLLDIFATAYAVRLKLNLARARELMAPRADWMRLARQMAFFMTPAHARYVSPTADPRDFPPEIYGESVEVKGFGPYLPGSYHELFGFIVKKLGKVNQRLLSLGNDTGAFPIRELEKAIYAVFLDADVVIPTGKRNVGPYVMAHEDLVAPNMTAQVLQAGGTLLAGSQMMQKGGLQMIAPVPAAPVEEDDSNRVLNLWRRGLLFKTSDDLASRSPSPHRDALIRILREIIERNNAHEIQKLIESLQENSLDVSSDGLIRLLEMRHLPNQPSLLARPAASKKNQWMGMPASPFQVTPSGTTPVASPVTVGH